MGLLGLHESRPLLSVNFVYGERRKDGRCIPQTTGEYEFQVARTVSSGRQFDAKIKKIMKKIIL